MYWLKTWFVIVEVKVDTVLWYHIFVKFTLVKSETYTLE
jgi:hypothetical protein